MYLVTKVTKVMWDGIRKVCRMGHQGGTLVTWSWFVRSWVVMGFGWMDGELVIKYLKLLQSLFEESNRVSCILSSTLDNSFSTIEFSSSRKEWSYKKKLMKIQVLKCLSSLNLDDLHQTF
jgi:hypothetical protein